METQALIEGLITYLCFIPILTFHEFAHAWTAWRCGDDTARSLGRVTLNPVAHIDPIGTVALPLLAIGLSASGSGLSSFIIGWGKPVPVNVANLRNRRADDTLIALAGPAMNVLLAAGLMIVARVGLFANQSWLIEMAGQIALLSLFLCFFNLLPIPPLDGSHVVKNLIGMSYETYWKLCRYGFIMVIVLWQVPPVRNLVAGITLGTFRLMARLVGL
jgi:Zn-dependent protease